MTIILYIILHKFAIFYITGKMQKEMEEFCMDIRLLEEATGTLRQISNLASEAHNSNLEDTFQQIARRMSHEIQEAEAVMRQMRNIANSN